MPRESVKRNGGTLNFFFCDLRGDTAFVSSKAFASPRAIASSRVFRSAVSSAFVESVTRTELSVVALGVPQAPTVTSRQRMLARVRAVKEVRPAA